MNPFDEESQVPFLSQGQPVPEETEQMREDKVYQGRTKIVQNHSKGQFEGPWKLKLV